MEEYLIRHCAPTLANIKTANLFNYTVSSAHELEAPLRLSNRQLNEKGVFLEALGVWGARALIFVYRQSKLERDLQKSGVLEFLAAYGYQTGSAAHCIGRLKERLASKGAFPHEIGLFLGYPLEDVTGFIEHAGSGCVYAGYWKVYGDAYRAMQTFARYSKCRRLYEHFFALGRTLAQLTVAAC